MLPVSVRIIKLPLHILLMYVEFFNKNVVTKIFTDLIQDGSHPFIIIVGSKEFEDKRMKILQLFFIEIQRCLINQSNLINSIIISYYPSPRTFLYKHRLDINYYLVL